MPTDTTDQQITIPIGADAADNPVAFTNNVADVEQRLVRRYTDLADRTARMAVLTENDLSTLATEDRVEVYNGTNHISLYRRALFAAPRVTVNQTLTASSTALQNVTALVAAMPTAGTFDIRGVIYYSATTVADIKFAFLLPAAATIVWNGPGIIPGAGGTGDFTATASVASDSAIGFGGNGAGTIQAVQIEGTYVAGGTAGNLQFRAAQNTSEASATVVHVNSRIEIWRAL